MDLDRDQIVRKDFKVSFRGYDEWEVQRHLREVHKAVSHLLGAIADGDAKDLPPAVQERISARMTLARIDAEEILRTAREEAESERSQTNRLVLATLEQAGDDVAELVARGEAQAEVLRRQVVGERELLLEATRDEVERDANRARNEALAQGRALADQALTERRKTLDAERAELMERTAEEARAEAERIRQQALENAETTREQALAAGVAEGAERREALEAEVLEAARRRGAKEAEELVAGATAQADDIRVAARDAGRREADSELDRRRTESEREHAELLAEARERGEALREQARAAGVAEGRAAREAEDAAWRERRAAEESAVARARREYAQLEAERRGQRAEWAEEREELLAGARREAGQLAASVRAGEWERVAAGIFGREV